MARILAAIILVGSLSHALSSSIFNIFGERSALIKNVPNSPSNTEGDAPAKPIPVIRDTSGVSNPQLYKLPSVKSSTQSVTKPIEPLSTTQNVKSETNSNNQPTNQHSSKQKSLQSTTTLKQSLAVNSIPSTKPLTQNSILTNAKQTINTQTTPSRGSIKGKIFGDKNYPLSKYYGNEITQPYLAESEIIDLSTNPKYRHLLDIQTTSLSSKLNDMGFRLSPTRIPGFRDNPPSDSSPPRLKQRSHMPAFLDRLPKLDLHIDPVINLKLKKEMSLLGTSITFGTDYLSDMMKWRGYCSVEDKIFRGRFSIRGSELGWAKSWMWNLGLMKENSAKFKLRMGLNLNTYKAYARLRFRSEPFSNFDFGQGIACAGKLPMTVPFPVVKELPLRVEYKFRFNAHQPSLNIDRQRDGKISVSTGIDRVDLSLDEVNFCLEWDEKSPVWGIGFTRPDNGRLITNFSALTRRNLPIF